MCVFENILHVNLHIIDMTDQKGCQMQILDLQHEI